MKKIWLFLLICTFFGVLSGCGSNPTAAERTKTKAKDVVEHAARHLLPVRYSYMEEGSMPKVQNQEGTNTCWAFASLTALESSKDNYLKKSFSADHLLAHNSFERKFEDGGSYVVPMSYLLSWEGPVLEETDPWDGESEEGLSAAVHVQEIRCIEPGDYEALKRFIYLYGGVESSLYLDFDEFVQNSSYYNEETNSYCYLGDNRSNHEVVIIGWDDKYPAENFKGDVTRDGAFLCQNSWGDSFGNQGTFYVSYEDVNIGGYGIVYSGIEPNDNYDFIYQSDLCGFTAQIGYAKESCWFANVYTAEESISLRAAGFYATGKNTEYEIYLVDNFVDESTFRSKESICSGYLKDAGYYTVDFPEPKKIDAGNEFAVIVKIHTEGAEYPVAIECPVEGLSENADLSDGKGYLSNQGMVWEHIEETKEYNICLKAYADLPEK